MQQPPSRKKSFPNSTSLDDEANLNDYACQQECIDELLKQLFPETPVPNSPSVLTLSPERESPHTNGHHNLSGVKHETSKSGGGEFLADQTSSTGKPTSLSDCWSLYMPKWLPEADKVDAATTTTSTLYESEKSNPSLLDNNALQLLKILAEKELQSNKSTADKAKSSSYPVIGEFLNGLRFKREQAFSPSDNTRPIESLTPRGCTDAHTPRNGSAEGCPQFKHVDKLQLPTTPVGSENSRTTGENVQEHGHWLLSDSEGVDLVSNSLVFFSDGSLNLDLFKVYSCKNESQIHDRKNCPFHHSLRDRRRHPVRYKAEQCDDHFDLDEIYSCVCPRGEMVKETLCIPVCCRCNKCHNRHELLYHPAIYKQRFCSSYNHMLQRSLLCHRGRFCAFAHSRNEIRCQLFSEQAESGPDSKFFMMDFKTFWCPFGIQHDWHGCLYAHTYQDCRRTPDIGYGSEPCPYWQKDLHSADYQKRCPYGTRCPYSHGSKEQLYHPAYYKTMPCADYKTKRSCPRGHLCAFYHDPAEKRCSTSGSNGSTAESDGALPLSVYDYSSPLPTSMMALLQKNFMNPPLFNLDDFEAFGHASRIEHGRRESNNTPQHGMSRANTPAYPGSPFNIWSGERYDSQRQDQQQNMFSNNRRRRISSAHKMVSKFGRPENETLEFLCESQDLIQSHCTSVNQRRQIDSHQNGLSRNSQHNEGAANRAGSNEGKLISLFKNGYQEPLQR